MDFDLLLPLGNFLVRTTSRTAAGVCHRRGFTTGAPYDDAIGDAPVLVVPMRVVDGQVVPLHAGVGEVTLRTEPGAVVLVLPPLLHAVARLHLADRLGAGGVLRIDAQPGVTTAFEVPNVGLLGVRFP